MSPPWNQTILWFFVGVHHTVSAAVIVDIYCCNIFSSFMDWNSLYLLCYFFFSFFDIARINFKYTCYSSSSVLLCLYYHSTMSSCGTWASSCSFALSAILKIYSSPLNCASSWPVFYLHPLKMLVVALSSLWFVNFWLNCSWVYRSTLKQVYEGNVLKLSLHRRPENQNWRVFFFLLWVYRPVRAFPVDFSQYWGGIKEGQMYEKRNLTFLQRSLHSYSEQFVIQVVIVYSVCSFGEHKVWDSLGLI